MQFYGSSERQQQGSQQGKNNLYRKLTKLQNATKGNTTAYPNRPNQWTSQQATSQHYNKGRNGALGTANRPFKGAGSPRNSPNGSPKFRSGRKPMSQLAVPGMTGVPTMALAPPPGLSLSDADTWSNFSAVYSDDSDNYIDAFERQYSAEELAEQQTQILKAQALQQYEHYLAFQQFVQEFEGQPFSGFVNDFKGFTEGTNVESLPVDFGIDEFDNSDNAAGLSSGHYNFNKLAQKLGGLSNSCANSSNGSTSDGEPCFYFSTTENNSPRSQNDEILSPILKEYNEMMATSTLQQKRKLQKKLKLCLQVNGIEMSSFDAFVQSRSPTAREELSMLLWNCDMNVHKVLNTYWDNFAKVGLNAAGESITSLMDHGKRLRGFFNLKLQEWSASRGWDLEPKPNSPAFSKIAEQRGLNAERLASVVKAQNLIRTNAERNLKNAEKIGEQVSKPTATCISRDVEEVETALALIRTVTDEEISFLKDLEIKQLRVELLTNELFSKFEQFVVLSRWTLADSLEGESNSSGGHESYKRRIFEEIMHPEAKDQRAALFAQFKGSNQVLELTEEVVVTNDLVVGQRVRKNGKNAGSAGSSAVSTPRNQNQKKNGSPQRYGKNGKVHNNNMAFSRR